LQRRIRRIRRARFDRLGDDCVVDKLFGRKPAAAVIDVAERVGQLKGARTRSTRNAITPSGTSPSTFAIAGDHVIIEPAIDVTSPALLSGCTVGVTVGFASGDTLDVDLTGVTGVTKSYDAARGTLTLTGSKDAATYQSLLRKVTFEGTSGTSGKRTFTFGLGSALPNPENNHFYEFVTAPSNTSWIQARDAAAARSYFGLQGYLVTITDAAETVFVKDKIAGGGWIGTTAVTPTCPRTWRWVTGPEAGTDFFTNTSSGAGTAISGRYINWGPGQPDGCGGGENYGQATTVATRAAAAKSESRGQRFGARAYAASSSSASAWPHAW